MNSELTCPKCNNDNPHMLETTSHRREQMNITCMVCSHSWIHTHKDVPKEQLVKNPIKTEEDKDA